MSDIVEPDCKGKPDLSAHTLVVLGRCQHAVGGATYEYEESGCPNCGATARRQTLWACGTKQRAIKPTAENCLALAWNAERIDADLRKAVGAQPRTEP